MKFSKTCLVFLFVAAFFGGCASSSSSDNQIELADYAFIMYGTGSAKIAEGVLTVKNIIAKDGGDASITGTYVVNNWYIEDFGPKSSMGGDFSGDVNYKNGKLFINTNPKIADANVFFNATIYSSFYQGDWTYSTFRGPTTRGSLTITKKK